ncbi:MAG: two component transcriptional regulator, LuxR family [Candidatus Solibacter sp.]|nr:two component transcriptional regulator, LuxR family [Candidatus Solibacter sp.]
MIRILLIDDLTVVRESLVIALAAAPDMELQSCSSIDEGIGLLMGSSGLFDVVLIKQTLGGRKADELVFFANASGLKGRVLVITPGLSNWEQRRLTRLGVAGVFAKQNSLKDLIASIRDLACGRARFEGQAPSEEASLDRLSGQERRAAESVLAGLANKEIGANMGVSESCIKALLQRAFLKLGVRTRSQLVRVLMEASVGTPPGPAGMMQLMAIGGLDALQTDS